MPQSKNAISLLLTKHYQMNPDQLKIISHKQGPLRVIAGPGSGKTYSLTLLAMNLLLCENTPPEGIVLCTYTEKAAYEMQDRLLQIAHSIDYREDLSQIKIGTIHSICKQFLDRHLHHTPLGNNYETLDQFSQQLLIYRSLPDICLPRILAFFREEWGSDWKIAKKLQFLFDKVAEELILDKLLENSPKPTIQTSNNDTIASLLPHIYLKYKELLKQRNSVDFAHLQKYAYDLLKNQTAFAMIARNIRYILVDEYQDTNYIQEQILKLLASATGTQNLCVVGDEDQALYRFRGATVRNILEFDQTFPGCEQIYLTTNYRSHATIITTSNQWMDSLEVTLPQKNIFRTAKIIVPALARKSSDQPDSYPAVMTLPSHDLYEEAEKIAQLIAKLKSEGKIEDYSQVALLLRSVRSQFSDPYIQALKQHNISAYCPRAREYFNQPEIQLLVGCFAQILHFIDLEVELSQEQEIFISYIHNCKILLREKSLLHLDLQTIQQTLETEIWLADEQNTTREQQLTDYFYRLIFTTAFDTYNANKSTRAHLVLFSQYLQTFQNSFQYTTITNHNLAALRYDFFYTFLHLLHLDGANQFEDSIELTPPNHVQIMTIHQAKGLEFPVVIVGRMDKVSLTTSNSDKPLRDYYHRCPLEPEKYIPAFDLRRLFYVAFSRAKHFLILSAPQKPYSHFGGLWQTIPKIDPDNSMLASLPAAETLISHNALKRRFSLTSHIALYDTCPRQFEFLREYEFQPAHAANTFYGQLIHQTLEAIHRHALEGSLAPQDDELLKNLFEDTFYFLTCTGMTPLDNTTRQKAFTQILRYVDQNQVELRNIYDAEYDFQIEKDEYILTGTMDLLLRGKKGLEIIDFKTGPRPEKDSALLVAYKQQLYLYAHALERRTKQFPTHLYLYWTAEKNKADARMEIPYRSEDIEQVNHYFDSVSRKIRGKQFEVLNPPKISVCNDCDIRYLCTKQGLIATPTRHSYS